MAFRGSDDDDDDDNDHDDANADTIRQTANVTFLSIWYLQKTIFFGFILDLFILLLNSFIYLIV